MSSSFSSLMLFALILIKETSGLSLGNVYSKYIDRETIDQSDTFGFHIPKPIAYKGTEPIWPRSYGYSAEMFFDENGAAFPLRPRAKIGKLIRPMNNRGPNRYDENEDEETLQRIYKRFMKRNRN